MRCSYCKNTEWLLARLEKYQQDAKGNAKRNAALEKVVSNIKARADNEDSGCRCQ
jgi:hypothetical protein